VKDRRLGGGLSSVITKTPPPLAVSLLAASQVPPALPKSIVSLLYEIRDDHWNANAPEERDYDIAIGVGVSIAGFVGAYAYEMYRLWQEGALYLPPPFDSLLPH